jgi:hypothetical protein
VDFPGYWKVYYRNIPGVDIIDSTALTLRFRNKK